MKSANRPSVKFVKFLTEFAPQSAGQNKRSHRTEFWENFTFLEKKAKFFKNNARYFLNQNPVCCRLSRASPDRRTVYNTQ